MEIERKFLVNRINLDDLNITNIKRIEQSYLYIDVLTAVRKRKIEQNNKTKYTYTIKTDKTGLSVNEIEKEIDENTYNKLGNNENYNTIIKTRYVIPYKEHNIELDIFEGHYKGIAFAEIEFNSEDEANTFELPNWFGKEISDEITNADMARYDYKKDLLKLKKELD